MTSSSTYYYTKAMTDLFVSTSGDGGVAFQSIDSMSDFWIVSSLHLPKYTGMNLNRHFVSPIPYITVPFRTPCFCSCDSMLRAPCWMASTGPSGTTTSRWPVGRGPSSTTRTCCWGCRECARSRSRTTPARSTATSKTKSRAASTSTTRSKRTTRALETSTAPRELTANRAPLDVFKVHRSCNIQCVVRF